MQTILISNRIAEPSRGGAMPGGLAAALYAATDKNGAWWIGSSGKHTKENASEAPIHTKNSVMGIMPMRLIVAYGMEWIDDAPMA